MVSPARISAVRASAWISARTSLIPATSSMSSMCQSSVGVGVSSREDAIAYGLTGPNLRGSGVGMDLRKDKPYSGYEQYEFDVPVGTKGDCYERYLVRGEEMR